ncbi:MAG: hypothetical protein ACI3Z0_04915 [Candidatus Cryptobacteroides sp.]
MDITGKEEDVLTSNGEAAAAKSAIAIAAMQANTIIRDIIQIIPFV